MNENQAFSKLKEDFPIFEVKNRTSVSQAIALTNGEHVQIAPHGVGKIAAAEMAELPNMVLFTYVSPTVSEVKKSGLIGVRKQTDTATQEPKSPAGAKPKDVPTTTPPVTTGGNASAGKNTQ